MLEMFAATVRRNALNEAAGRIEHRARDPGLGEACAACLLDIAHTLRSEESS